MQLRVLQAARISVVVAAQPDDLGRGFEGRRAAAAYRDVHLRGSGAYRRNGAGRSHRQLVGAFDAERNRLKLRHVRVEFFHEAVELVGHHHAGRIADRDCRRARRYRGADRAVEELRLAARRVHRGEFHVGAERAALRHERLNHLDNPLGLLVADELHLHRRERRFDVKARMRRLSDRVPRRLHARLLEADRNRKRAALHRRRDSAHEQRINLLVYNRREADDVEVQPVENLRGLDNLLERERPFAAARSLAQRNVRKPDLSHPEISPSPTSGIPPRTAIKKPPRHIHASGAKNSLRGTTLIAARTRPLIRASDAATRSSLKAARRLRELRSGARPYHHPSVPAFTCAPALCKPIYDDRNSVIAFPAIYFFRRRRQNAGCAF